MNHPYSIEKRVFTCKNCGYTVQVFGESYFDHGCQHYIGTFFCKECQNLFEAFLTKVEVWETDGDFVYNLDDETMCLRCGSSNMISWNMNSGKCPKCEDLMTKRVIGNLRLHK